MISVDYHRHALFHVIAPNLRYFHSTNSVVISKLHFFQIAKKKRYQFRTPKRADWRLRTSTWRGWYAQPTEVHTAGQLYLVGSPVFLRAFARFFIVARLFLCGTFSLFVSLLRAHARTQRNLHSCSPWIGLSPVYSPFEIARWTTHLGEFSPPDA